MAMPGLVLWSFDGPPDEPNHNQAPLPSPPTWARPTRRDFIVIDSDSDAEPEVFHDASPVAASGSNDISGPTPRSSLQKIEPPSTPPTTPPIPDQRANQTSSNSRTVPRSPSLRSNPPDYSPGGDRTPADAIQRILRGERHSATFEGTSQYAAGGSSACGLASMNAIRLAFELCSRMMDPEQLVSALVSEDFVRAAMGIATYWPNDMHLEVEPILQLPLFSNSIRVLDNQYAVCTYRTFSNAVVALHSDEQSPGPRAVCLTRPPEVISVMHIPIPRSTSNDWTPWASPRRTESIYLVFDSHPRPNHPNGAAVHIFPARSTDDVADYLMDLFQVDQEIMNDPNLEWTVQLLGQLSYHLLAPALGREPTDEYVLNMRILEENRKRTWAEDKLKAAEAETRKLRSQVFDQQQEIAMLKFKDRRTRDEVQGLKEQLNRPRPTKEDQRTGWFSSGNRGGEGSRPQEDHRNAGWFSSGNRGSESHKSKGKGRDISGGPAPGEETKSPSWFGNDNKGGESNRSTEKGWGPSGGTRAPPGVNPSTRTSGTSNFEFSPLSRSPTRPPPTYNSVSSWASGPSNHRRATIAEEENARSLELALRLQREFDDETAKVSMGESLAKSMERATFDCGICMDTFTDEAIARIDGCGHSCCRDCMRSSIQSKIEERRYPIPCPFCMAGSDDNDSQRRGAGTISPWIVETIGISSELFNVYTELQLAEHSIMVDCRGCSSPSIIYSPYGY
ncbi:unnamed protein product [Rhizoctonia solani]|uniref:RING-type domain-containing protein n=1 Tax=Rhizoctonia solani TaxID=456999 RepID=A0A8H2X152_9AGAM|nr:unnamed protein product [Rhizoctonia solani]